MEQVRHISGVDTRRDPSLKAREFDPFGHAGLTPSGIIRLTPSGKIKMTPVDDTAGEFFVVLRVLVLARRGSMSNTTKYDCKIKNILRCYAVGMGIKETANTFHISRNTVRKYVRPAVHFKRQAYRSAA